MHVLIEVVNLFNIKIVKLVAVFFSVLGLSLSVVRFKFYIYQCLQFRIISLGPFEQYLANASGH